MLLLSVFICISLVNSAESTITACENTWIPFEGNCYMFGTGQTTFIEAQNSCQQNSSHLVEIYNSNENAFLKKELRRLNLQCAWIGMRDVTEGLWLWESNGARLEYSDFHPGQADPGHDDQDCGIFWRDYNYQWADHWCNKHCIPLCKQRGERVKKYCNYCDTDQTLVMISNVCSESKRFCKIM